MLNAKETNLTHLPETEEFGFNSFFCSCVDLVVGVGLFALLLCHKLNEIN